MRKKLLAVCITAVCLLCGCSKTDTISNETSIPKTVENITVTSDSVKSVTDLGVADIIVCYKGHFDNTEHITKGDYDLTKAVMNGETAEPHTVYRMSSDGSFSYENSYDYCADDVKCRFSYEKAQEFFEFINACDLQEYEMYYANEHGVMVEEKYPDFYIYDLVSRKVYILPENEFITVMEKVDEFKKTAEKNQ